MPNSLTSASQFNSEALRLAAELLCGWEQARPASAPITPEFRKAFNRFIAEVLSTTQETNLESTDVQEVLRGATGLTIGRAEASGPGRIQQALQQAYQTTQAVGPHASPNGEINGKILLLVQSRPDTALEIDELTEITEILLQHTGPQWEMAFGHGIVPGLSTEIRLTFLLAPVTAQ